MGILRNSGEKFEFSWKFNETPNKVLELPN